MMPSSMAPGSSSYQPTLHATSGEPSAAHVNPVNTFASPTSAAGKNNRQLLGTRPIRLMHELRA